MPNTDLQHRPEAPSRRALPMRILGWTLLIWSVGLVSCQALFVL